MTIGILSKAAGISVETIRFYEQKGILPKPHRRPSGYREYAEQDVKTLKFILKAKQLGFSLGEIKELLCLYQNAQGHCCTVKDLLLDKKNEVQAKIKFLKKMESALNTIESSCDHSKPIQNCPFLALLDMA